MYRQNGMLTALLLPLYRVLFQDSNFQSQWHLRISVLH
jgi:hypothetical protein